MGAAIMHRRAWWLLLLPCVLYKLLVGVLLDAPHAAGYDVLCEKQPQEPPADADSSTQRCEFLAEYIDFKMMKVSITTEDPLALYMYTSQVTIPRARSFAACTVSALLLLTLLCNMPRRLAAFTAGAWFMLSAMCAYGSLAHPKTPPLLQYFHSTPVGIELLGPLLLLAGFG